MRSTADIGLEALVAPSGAVSGWTVVAGAVAAIGLARVMTLYHGTRDAGFKRFLRDRPTFFTTPERLHEARGYASSAGIGAAQCSPCKQKRVDPALLEVAVDPGRILDLTRPEDVAALADVVAELNAEATHPWRKIAPVPRLMDEAMSYRGSTCAPAVPYPLLARRDFVRALAARGYDSAWTTEGGYQSLAVLNARDRARILRIERER